MQLNQYYQTLYYRGIAASGMKALKEVLAHALFPKASLRDKKQEGFEVAETGYIRYRAAFFFGANHKLITLAPPPPNKDAAVKAYQTWAKKSQENLDMFAKKDKTSYPDLFRYLQLRQAEPIYHQETKRLSYWLLHFGVELPALSELRPKAQVPSVAQQIQAQLYGTILQNFTQTTIPAGLKALYDKMKTAPLSGESMRVYVGSNGIIVGLDYNHLPLASSTSTDLWEVVQPKDEEKKVYNLVFQRMANGLVAAVSPNGEARCKEAVGEALNKVIRIASNNRIFLDQNILDNYGLILSDMLKMIPRIPICKILWDVYSSLDLYRPTTLKKIVTEDKVIYKTEDGTIVPPEKMKDYQALDSYTEEVKTEIETVSNILARDIYINFQDFHDKDSKHAGAFTLCDISAHSTDIKIEGNATKGYTLHFLQNADKAIISRCNSFEGFSLSDVDLENRVVSLITMRANPEPGNTAPPPFENDNYKNSNTKALVFYTFMEYLFHEIGAHIFACDDSRGGGGTEHNRVGWDDRGGVGVVTEGKYIWLLQRQLRKAIGIKDDNSIMYKTDSITNQDWEDAKTMLRSILFDPYIPKDSFLEFISNNKAYAVPDKK